MYEIPHVLICGHPYKHKIAVMNLNTGLDSTQKLDADIDDAFAVLYAKDAIPELIKRLVKWDSGRAKCPYDILLYPCGDIYETYRNDAILASKILGIKLDYFRNAESNDVFAVIKFSVKEYEDSLKNLLIHAGKKLGRVSAERQSGNTARPNGQKDEKKQTAVKATAPKATGSVEKAVVSAANSDDEGRPKGDAGNGVCQSLEAAPEHKKGVYTASSASKPTFPYQGCANKTSTPSDPTSESQQGRTPDPVKPCDVNGAKKEARAKRHSIKDNNQPEARSATTLVLGNDTIRKLKLLAVYENTRISALAETAITRFIASWENRNGRELV